jgi:hypothetical protein
MGLAAVARVTDSHWIACSVLDEIDFGLTPVGEPPERPHPTAHKLPAAEIRMRSRALIVRFRSS